MADGLDVLLGNSATPANGLDVLLGSGPQPAPAQVTSGTKNNDLASQLGLFARSAIKGVAAVPAMLADAVTGPINAAQDLLLGPGQGYRFQAQLPALDALMTRAGLPVPDTPTQRIVSKGVELGTGAGTAAKAADAASRILPGAAGNVMGQLAADPVMQVAAGTGSGLAGQQSAENGNGWGSQLISSVLGGVGAAGLLGGARVLSSAVANRFFPPTAAVPAEIESRVIGTLQAQGIDPATITPAIRESLANDVASALRSGGGSLDGPALARLADYRRLGLTPTRGRLTLDPFDVTQEQNAMRLAAATGAKDARLPQIAQANNSGLINAVEALSPVADNTMTGSAAVAPIRAADAAAKAQVDALYAAARAQAGRDALLDGHTFTQNANQALQQNLAPKLGPEVDQVLNDIATGKTPLTVGYAEQLKTMLGRKAQAAKANNGDLAYAYGLVRQALDDAPLMPAPSVNAGNLPAIPGTVPPSPATAGADAAAAFDAARSAARQRFTWQESSPVITKALDSGVNVDTFIRNNIMSPSASTDDVSNAAQVIAQDPAAVAAVRSAIAQRLKQAAFGNGNPGQTANFSGRQWMAALSDIGDRKLGLFFSPEEVEQLKAIGRVGSIETFQPRGSAVNNSNTTAAAMKMLQDVTNKVAPLAAKLPFGGWAFDHAIRAPIGSMYLSALERGAGNVPGAIYRPVAPSQPGGLLDPLLLPMTINAGLLAPPQ